MRIYRCPACDAEVYFRNLTCSCGQALEFHPGQDSFKPLQNGCANREKIDCNWVASEKAALCASCATTEVIPDLSLPENLQLWSDAELAKRWVLIGLYRLGWFVPGAPRPVFRFLAEATSAGKQRVVMGHAAGVITINVTEADPVIRVTRREALDEDYRTLIGHMRHELAHFMQWVLYDTPQFVTAFRALFGDETADYGAALKDHYQNDAPADWQSLFITAYASAHPHEDWAESVAHLLHLVDILDSAEAAGLHLPGSGPPLSDAYLEDNSELLISKALDYGISLNHLNRSMGLADLYPFVVNDPARRKLVFVHNWVRLPQAARPMTSSETV